MGLDIKTAQQNSYVPKVPTTNEAPKISGGKTGGISSNSVADVIDVNNAGSVAQHKIPSAYETRKSRTAIEADLDKLVKQLMPDLGVRFKVHDSGNVITSVVNNETDEIVREFPAEKILDIVYSMCVKLGIVVNKKM